MTISTFDGFPPALYEFLDKLAVNNNREWFNRNKTRYRAEVLMPMCGFIAAFGPRLARISPHFVADPRPNGGSMFRVYRDIRFAKDKKPYKEHAACQFRHEAGKDVHAPGFYLHLDRDGVWLGGGIWKPPAKPLYKIRERIQLDAKGWGKIIRSQKIKSRFGAVEGERLKRAPRGFSEETPYIDDIKLKSFLLMTRMDRSDALSPSFIDEVEDTFRGAMSLLHFLAKALELPS